MQASRPQSHLEGGHQGIELESHSMMVHAVIVIVQSFKLYNSY
jgi:hypothetical protein